MRNARSDGPMATVTVTFATIVVATDAMIPNGFAGVIAAQARAVAIAADAAGMARITVAAIATITTAIATAVTAAIATTVTTTATTLRVGGVHDGQISGQ